MSRNFSTFTPGTAPAGSISNAELADMTGPAVKGRVTGTGAPADLTPAQARETISWGWGIFEAETAAIINAMATRPPRSLAFAMDDLVVELKANGWWAEIGYLLVPTLHTEQASLLDWKNPAQSATNNGATFAAYQGFTGDGASAYIATVAPTSVTGYALNTAHQFVWSEDGVDTDPLVAVASGTCTMQINPRSGGGNFAVRVNVTVGVSVGAAADRDGLFHVRRTVNTDFDGFHNGALVANVVNTATTTQTEVTALMRNGAAFTDDRVLAYGIGGTSAADPADLYDALDAFYTAIGTTHS